MTDCELKHLFSSRLLAKEICGEKQTQDDISTFINKHVDSLNKSSNTKCIQALPSNKQDLLTLDEKAAKSQSADLDSVVCIEIMTKATGRSDANYNKQAIDYARAQDRKLKNKLFGSSAIV